jgi:hypothetical protein
MDVIKQILSSFRSTLPAGSRTAAAIDRGAPPEEISVCATEEGLHALAGALFEACEQGLASGPGSDPDVSVNSALSERLRAFRLQLPTSSATAKLIDAGASLEEISEAAESEGLDSLVGMLVEAEQEQSRRGT